MGVLSNLDWISFLLGVAFVMFILPLVSQFLGRVKGRSAKKAAA